MRTKIMLTSATKDNAATALATALERGWTPQSIEKYGNKFVRAAMKQAQTSAKPAGAAKVRPKLRGQLGLTEHPQAPVVAHITPKGVTRPRAQQAKDIKWGDAAKLEVVLTRAGENKPAELIVADPRPKIIGEGKTYDCMIGGHHFTLSERAMERLLNGRTTTAWLADGHSYAIAVK